MTTKQLAAEYRRRERTAGGPLWRSSFQMTAQVLETQHRGRAAKTLRRMERKFAAMSLSATFGGAATALEREIRRSRRLASVRP